MLYPFDPNNVDYSKCLTPLSSHNNESTPEPLKCNVTNQPSYLEYLETKFDPSVLQSFKQHYTEKTSPETNLLSLYEVWVKFKTDVDGTTSAINSDRISYDVENDIEFSFPEFNSLFPDTEPELVQYNEQEYTTGSVNSLDNQNKSQMETQNQVS